MIELLDLTCIIPRIIHKRRLHPQKRVYIDEWSIIE